MKKFWALLIIPVVLALWWGLDSRGSMPDVHFAEVRRLTIESTVTTNGKVEPAEWAAARAEIAGVVQRVGVQRGDAVKTGQVLLSLDATAARSDLVAAEAKAQQASAELTTVGQGGRAATVANLNDSIRSAQEAVDVAQRNYDIMQRLERQQAATKLQVQDAKDALERAKLQLAAFQNQRKTQVTASDRALAQAKLRDAQAGVALAQHRLALNEVKSPIDGTVYQFDVKVGAYMQPGDLVALVGKLDRVKVIVYVDEPDLGRVAENKPVKITWEAAPGREWWGHVDRLPTQVVAQGTRMVGEVSTIIENPNHDLLPGVTVNATIVSAVVKNANAVPKSALRSVHGESGVYRLSHKTVVWTPVKTGVSDINNVQVISGVQAGDRVAQPSGDVEIKSGMRVNPVME